MLYHEAPLEYSLMKKAIGQGTPTADFIEQIGYASLNPLFKTQKFREALKYYRECGLYSGTPIKNTPAKELYYIRLRRNNPVE